MKYIMMLVLVSITLTAQPNDAVVKCHLDNFGSKDRPAYQVHCDTLERMDEGVVVKIESIPGVESVYNLRKYSISANIGSLHNPHLAADRIKNTLLRYLSRPDVIYR